LSSWASTYAKFKVSMTNHYEDMKGDRKCEKWGGSGFTQGQ